MSDFDFSAVAVTEAEMPKSGAGRPRSAGPNPFTETLAQSYEAREGGKNGRQIKVPGANVAQAVYLIRRAADDLGIGARVVIQDGKGETVTGAVAKDNPRKTYTVLFAGKDRRKAKDAEGADSADEGEGTETQE